LYVAGSFCPAGRIDGLLRSLLISSYVHLETVNRGKRKKGISEGIYKGDFLGGFVKKKRL
jgi:hypothetical protein